MNLNTTFEHIIYLNEKIRLLFTSKEEKMDYVINEYKYTLNERNRYMTCPKEEIAEAMKAREKKRIEFARKNHFTQHPNRPGYWRKDLTLQSFPKDAA